MRQIGMKNRMINHFQDFLGKRNLRRRITPRDLESLLPINLACSFHEIFSSIINPRYLLVFNLFIILVFKFNLRFVWTDQILEKKNVNFANT